LAHFFLALSLRHAWRPERAPVERSIDIPQTRSMLVRAYADGGHQVPSIGKKENSSASHTAWERSVTAAPLPAIDANRLPARRSRATSATPPTCDRLNQTRSLPLATTIGQSEVRPAVLFFFFSVQLARALHCGLVNLSATPVFILKVHW
jgi:hypothetical protein